jgi:hypothetical protein
MINPRRLLPANNPRPDFNKIMCRDPKQVLILGDGFAGVYTARHLEKLLRPEEALPTGSRTCCSSRS